MSWLQSGKFINMESRKGGLEDDVPFQLGDFLGSSSVHFPGNYLPVAHFEGKPGLKVYFCLNSYHLLSHKSHAQTPSH